MLLAFNQSLGCPYEDRHMSCACRLCGDPEHWVTLCEFNIIKSDKFNAYIRIKLIRPILPLCPRLRIIAIVTASRSSHRCWWCLSYFAADKHVAVVRDACYDMIVFTNSAEQLSVHPVPVRISCLKDQVFKDKFKKQLKCLITKDRLNLR